MIDYRRMRGSAGLADLQNWTRFDLSGSQAGDALDAVVGCNVRDLFEGRAANTLIPSPTGGVDAVVWVVALEDGFRIVAEPADHEAIRTALVESASGRDAVLRDIGERTFALALVGPDFMLDLVGYGLFAVIALIQWQRRRRSATGITS